MKGHRMLHTSRFATLSVAAFGLLSACGGVVGGAGQLSNGEPLSVVQIVEVTPDGPVITLDIASPEGWSCKSRFRDEGPVQQQSVRRTYPITCSDGAKGNIVVTWDNVQKRQNGAFALDNGRSGSVLFDFEA
jgi:hypothetical protein